MRIGVDITAFYIAQAGVLNYFYNVLRHLVQLDPENEYILLDYASLRSGLSPMCDLNTLKGSNSQIVTCSGIRHRRLTRWRLMQTVPGGIRLAEVVDRLLEPGWELATRRINQRRLEEALDGVEIFHSSDVFQFIKTDAKNVVTMYDLSAFLFPQLHTQETVRRQREVLRFATEKADHIIAISHSTKRDLITHLSISLDKISVVYGGVDERYHPIEDKAAIARVAGRYGVEPGCYLLHVGTLEPRKNLVRLVRAFASVHWQYPDYKLMLVGRRGWLYEDIFAEVEKLDFQRAVVFAGFVPEDDLPALMSGAALFVYPSLYEGFGLPVLEAMACGTPVIASNTSSLPEVAGDAGLLVNPEDESALADAMMAVLGDEAQRQEMAHRGRQQAARFSWEQAARQTMKVYRG